MDPGLRGFFENAKVALVIAGLFVFVVLLWLTS